MTYPRESRLVFGIGLAAAVAAGFVAGIHQELLLKLIYLTVALAAALALSPQMFIAGTVLAFAVSTTATNPVVPSLPFPIYFADFAVLLVALRGAWPRDRRPSQRPLAGAPSILFAIWAAIMAIAAARAWATGGVPLASALRGDLALFYWPLLYFGYGRTLRERSLDVPSLWRNLAVVALGLTAWMFLARAINHPFANSGLADVPTGNNDQFVQRNYGFAGAFVIYPIIALVGVAGMAHETTRSRRWTTLAAVGTVATLFTLVRGEIFGLAVAVVVVLLLRSQRLARTARVRAAIQLASAIVLVVLGLVVVKPTLGDAIVQRALPFTHQAQEATLNANYRENAVKTGLRSAQAHPFGQGVLDVRRLEMENIDPGFLAHSGLATLLLFGGWPALASALAAVVAVIRRSAALARPTPWLHPAFVGTLTLFTVYSFGAASLAGDPWVIPLGVLAVAVRFRLVDQTEGSSPRTGAASHSPRSG